MVDFQAIRMSVPLTEVVARYVDLVKKGSEYGGLCPFHDEATASFKVFVGTDGFEHYHCFGCGANGDVVDFIVNMQGVSPMEAVEILTNGSLPAAGSFKRESIPKNEYDVWGPIIPVPDDAPEYNPANTYNPKRAKHVCYRPERMDAYRTAEGKLICYVVRMYLSDGKKITPVVTFCEGPGGVRQWTAKRMKPPYPLLGLPELAANPKSAVIVVSGEKCWDDARREFKELVAVTWLGGDQCADKADLSPLKGRWITFWPDADPSGQQAVELIQRKLQND